ncbi:unnamed protein product [Amoebophrya sp. A25]|nr:unnamed protein product [Amoebophrya sp. A25]|eukprot:GSA25T00024678001.1
MIFFLRRWKFVLLFWYTHPIFYITTTYLVLRSTCCEARIVAFTYTFMLNTLFYLDKQSLHQVGHPSYYLESKGTVSVKSLRKYSRKFTKSLVFFLSLVFSVKYRVFFVGREGACGAVLDGKSCITACVNAFVIGFSE